MKKIKLTQGRSAMVDDEDFEWLNQWNWYLDSHGYATKTNNSNNSKIFMHRIIMNCPIGTMIDHIDRDPLNNRRDNLRFCNHAQNAMNKKKGKNYSTTYKGVRISDGKYICAQIKLNGKSIHLGTFPNEETAARAYDIKAKELFGEYARLNFPE
jgi:hypothetical protein